MDVTVGVGASVATLHLDELGTGVAVVGSGVSASHLARVGSGVVVVVVVVVVSLGHDSYATQPYAFDSSKMHWEPNGRFGCGPGQLSSGPLEQTGPSVQNAPCLPTTLTGIQLLLPSHCVGTVVSKTQSARELASRCAPRTMKKRGVNLTIAKSSAGGEGAT